MQGMSFHAMFARSFKEAQNYMTPFFLLVAMPAMIAGLPGIKLSGITQLVPIANVVLLFKDLMTGQASLDAVFLVLLSTSIFAGLALLLAAWLFQREDIVLGGGAAALSFDRRAIHASTTPSPPLTVWLPTSPSASAKPSCPACRTPPPAPS